MGIPRWFVLCTQPGVTAVEPTLLLPDLPGEVCGAASVAGYLWTFERIRKCRTSHTPPRFRRDYPLNLSISVSGGKESNSDSLSSGERNGNSPAHNLPGYQACGEMLRQGNGR